MHDVSPLLQFAEDRLQILALLFMGLVYILKIRWILKFPAGRERQAPTGNPPGDWSSGARYSLFNIVMPWAMASTRRHRFFYAQFVLFHLGVAASIGMSFIIPYSPGLIAGKASVFALQAIFAVAVVIGMGRLVRRIRNPYVRAISTPDDYISLALLIIWLGSSILAAPNDRQSSEIPLLSYFFLTAFLLAYVPFSKISHYIYYPFARWYLGKTLGHRGVYPVAQGL